MSWLQPKVSQPNFMLPDNLGVAQAINQGTKGLYQQQLHNHTIHQRTVRRNNNYTHYNAHQQSKANIPWAQVKK